MNKSNSGTIVLATRNSGKLREFRSLFTPAGYRIIGLNDLGIDMEVEESGNTFTANACLKAVAYSRCISHPVLADDSGLEVIALQGRPGIHSARYAGPEASDSDRIHRLLNEIRHAGVGREARFVCALALAREGKVLFEAEGICHGIITDTPRGKNGFGYDPIFLLPESGKTMAELNETEKNAISHRARAVQSLLSQIGPIDNQNRKSIVNRKSSTVNRSGGVPRIELK
jgi:XTP/dITP diphosphohydrolase